MAAMRPSHLATRVADSSTKGESTMTESDSPPKEIVIPRHLVPFVGVSPRMLADELEEDYYRLFDIMADEIAPTNNLEWFAVNDVVDLLWDISRLRLWKNAILYVSRQAALETALLRTHPSTHPVGPYRIKISREEAEEWRTNPEKRDVLEARISEAGYDSDALNAGAFIEAQAPLATIDRFLCSARGQLNATLKEIGVRREFAERARKAFDERLKLTVEVSKPAQIGPN
jgi:hypothetical protein